MTSVDPKAGAAAPAWIRSRLHAGLKAFATLSLAATACFAQAQTTTTTRTAFVHLLEWKWTDIAKECESHLGPKGFAAVQVSPPNEHNWIASGDGAPYPWWMRYQPVSYSLDRSRSGTRAEFADMVNRCNAVGVGIYVDAVINHMSGGTGGSSSAGSGWSNHDYPRVPYDNADFHSPVCGINSADYTSDSWRVWNCELSGLQDLNTGGSKVRGKIADYLVDLVNLGVKGFRVDAAKHMAPVDLGAIIDAVNGRVATRPFWYLEVIQADGEAVQPSHYLGLGGGLVNVLEFKYGTQIAGKFNGKLAELKTLGEGWGLTASGRGVAFIDNHDKQRGHGGGGSYMTYHWGAQYDLANVFMLAWPYGYPQVMSSYAFSNSGSAYDSSYGPPYNSDGSTKGPWDGGVSTPACLNQTRGGWVCEHRFRPIANMVGFRNATVANWTVNNWWDNGNNQIAFGRGDKGFVVINKESTALSRSFATGLPAGQYCDVISGDFAAGACSGTVITVVSGGAANISVPAYSAAAIHVGAVVGTPPDPGTGTTATVTFNVTASTVIGQNVYVVGDSTALGVWAPANAKALSVVPGTGSGQQNQWAASFTLPAGTAIQYKYIKKDAAGNTTWESGSNRTVTTPAAGASVTLTNTWQ